MPGYAVSRLRHHHHSNITVACNCRSTSLWTLKSEADNDKNSSSKFAAPLWRCVSVHAVLLIDGRTEPSSVGAAIVVAAVKLGDYETQAVCPKPTLYWQHNLAITLNIVTLISIPGFLSVVFAAEEAAAEAAAARTVVPLFP